jgi:hypothetical protein
MWRRECQETARIRKVARSGRPGRGTAYFAWVDGVACQVTFFALDGASLPYEATLAAMVASLQASPPVAPRRPAVAQRRPVGGVRAAQRAYGLAARWRRSNSSRVQIVRTSVSRSSASTPSRWSISCCSSSARSPSARSSCQAPAVSW